MQIMTMYIPLKGCACTWVDGVCMHVHAEGGRKEDQNRT